MVLSAPDRSAGVPPACAFQIREKFRECPDTYLMAVLNPFDLKQLEGILLTFMSDQHRFPNTKNHTTTKRDKQDHLSQAFPGVSETNLSPLLYVRPFNGRLLF